MDAAEGFDNAKNALDTKDLTQALPEPNSQRKNLHAQTPSSKASAALKAKQEKRKFRGSSVPNPSLNIPLDEFTSFTQYLQSSKRVFALIGAGLSASSGISTYCGNDRHWRGLEPRTLADIATFWDDPIKLWWCWSYRMKGAQEALPNHGHVALAKLAKENEGFVAVNQNIDGLCQRAGFPENQIAHIHGTLFEMKCSRNVPGRKDRCNYSVPVSYPVNDALTIPADLDIGDASVPLPDIRREQLPYCPTCKALMRPSVVLFGESPPSSVTDRIHAFTSAGPIDLMLVVGTSAVVFPAAGNIITARNAGARVAFFNLEEYDEEPGCVYAGDWMFKGDAAEMVPACLKGVVGAVGSR